MFGCSNKSIYFLDTARIIRELEGALNDSLDSLVRRSASRIQFKKLKHLPFGAHYVRIRTQYFLKNVDDLNYNYEELAGQILDADFCDEVAMSIVGSKVEERNKIFYFSCVSGRRLGKNYLIIIWR